MHGSMHGRQFHPRQRPPEPVIERKPKSRQRLLLRPATHLSLLHEVREELPHCLRAPSRRGTLPTEGEEPTEPRQIRLLGARAVLPQPKGTVRRGHRSAFLIAGSLADQPAQASPFSCGQDRNPAFHAAPRPAYLQYSSFKHQRAASSRAESNARGVGIPCVPGDDTAPAASAPRENP